MGSSRPGGERLVASAGARRPLLYHHLGNKEGLYREAVLRSVQRFDAPLTAAASSSGSATDRLARDCRVQAEAVHARALTLDHHAPKVQECVVDPARGLPVDALGSIAPDDHELDGSSLAVVAAADFSARPSDRDTGDGSLDDLTRVLPTVVRVGRGRCRPEASLACPAGAAAAPTTETSLPEAQPCT